MPLRDPGPLRELAILRAMHRLLVQHIEATGDLDTSAILIAAQTGYLEGNPYDVSALSAVCRIPRPTVHRKLKAFEKATGRLKWRIEGRRSIPIIHTERPDMPKLLTQAEKIIHDAHELLSILDNYPVDHQLTDL